MLIRSGGRYGVLVRIQRFLDLGGSLAQRPHSAGGTLLHEAAIYNKADAVRWLVALGARLDARDCFGKTPEDIAAGYGDRARRQLRRALRGARRGLRVRRRTR
jgi:hypothetical protein